jgi:hypothetical protein
MNKEIAFVIFIIFAFCLSFQFRGDMEREADRYLSQENWKHYTQ